jgi:DNA (cytosine-5)-methyltransferase 1
MKELSLFSGAGLGQWATHHLLGWECLGYVEWDKYCQRVLRARMDDGSFSRAPIFGDIRQFIQSGAAERYRGFIDVVTAGFPCQPFSAAGSQLGADDPRNMWPATAQCIRLVQPQYALLENVPALINSGYFGRVLGDLAEMGFDARWGVFSACAAGAPHTRERLFILAYANSERSDRGWQCETGRISATRGEAQIRSRNSTKNYRPIQTALWNESAAEVLRMADGNTDRGNRIKAAGNGWVPIVAATAWQVLSSQIVVG